MPSGREWSEAQKIVLVADDNEDNRIICRTILEHAGHRVVEATNGKDGVRLARRRKPSTILLDGSTPLLDGWDAAKLLRRDPETATIPINMLTTHALEQDRAKARAVGCDTYLPKPVEPRRVVEEVERHIGPAGATSND